jgi:proteasome assembly chaperone (PAC2) family protein
MAEDHELRRPWLVAVWPGMGGVAVNAGYYLLSKLDMETAADFEAPELFDVEHVEVEHGLIRPGRLPRHRVFTWRDPAGRHDLVVLLGEAQPPAGKYAFCRKLIRHARGLGVERVFTFAAMATQMRPEDRSRVFAAATDAAGLEELKRLELEVLKGGHIGGLNGLLLGAAADAGLPGACLLGEMPHLFSQLPFPKASLGVLEAFAALARVEIDFTELAEQAAGVEKQLGELLERVEQQYGGAASAAEDEDEEEEEYTPEPAGPEERLASEDRQRVERLFDEARRDRAKAFELKQLLDRLNAFAEYEDRFLDLFKKAG